MNLNSRYIFLFDGVGAGLSLVFTGLVLPFFSDFIGISTQLLYTLSLLPLMFMSYSMICYFMIKRIKTWMLRTIIIANIFYCFMTIFIISALPTINIWGKAVLSAEIVVIFIVVGIEVKVYRSLKQQSF